MRKNQMRKNPFCGRGAYSAFAKSLYKRMMSREWFSYADVMADVNQCESAGIVKVSYCEKYGELKKACGELRERIEKKQPGRQFFEIQGNNKNQRIRYIGEDDNPLGDLLNVSVANDIKLYAQFCENSAGFFPVEWLEYFLEDTFALEGINLRRNVGKQIITTSVVRELTNINFLPHFYDAICKKQVLRIDYKPYDEPLVTHTFHPHVLREHNGRWFLLGHAVGQDPEFGYNFAIDRIEDFDVVKGEKYIPAPKGYYADMFRNIVGVSHTKDAVPETVVLRATSHKMINLTETKKIHSSQETAKIYGQYEDGEYGEFKLFVEVNNEFIGRILQMGEGLVVVSPSNVRECFRQRVLKMAELYKN